MKAIQILFPLALLYRIHCEEVQCKFGIDSATLGQRQPLLLDTLSNKLLQPSKDGEFVFTAGQTIDLACTSGLSGQIGGNRVTATCVRDDTFTVNRIPLQIKNIQCGKQNVANVMVTNRTCYDNSVIAKIGFQIDNVFSAIMELCHNAANMRTYYAHYHLYPAALNHQKLSARPTFKKPLYEKVTCNYTRKDQIDILMKELGTSKYIENTGEIYFARGHLAATADFVLMPSQFATFFYVNTAPTWQSVNNGNWKQIESSVRELAYNKSSGLDIYTGTYGILELPDASINANLKRINLGCNKGNDTRDKIPPPRLLYKIVIDQTTQKGVVLISVNNPHTSLANIQQTEIICTDISNNITWFPKSQRDDIRRGYSYACDVDSFLQITNHLPALPVTGVLTEAF